MKELSIDLETYSDVDISKCGAYKHAESDNFEILLFGVSVDGEPVKVYDLACGDTVPEQIWDEYHLDQEINDRGIALNMTVVENAIAFDERSREELTAAMQDITNLDNPNSVQQMKKWLSDNGVETESLDKKAVKELSKPRMNRWFRMPSSSVSSLPKAT